MLQPQRGVAFSSLRAAAARSSLRALPRSSRHRLRCERDLCRRAKDHSRSSAMPQPPDIRRYLKHGTLPQLRAFEASARLGSFTRAAQELYISQAAASVQIKKLTETVGLPLFEQVGKRVYLTDAGERLYAGCNEVFHALAN